MKFIKSDILLFLVIFIMGLFLVPSYGISLDEFDIRNLGFYNLGYIADTFGVTFRDEHNMVSWYSRVSDLYFDQTLGWKNMGTLYTSFLGIVEMLFGVDSDRVSFLFRHSANWLIFIIFLYHFSKLSALIFRSKFLALLSVLILVLSPRVFADSFYNIKDLILLSFYWIGFYWVIISNRKDGIKPLFLAAFFSAITINIRLIGISIVFIYLFDLFFAKKAFKLRSAVFYLISTFGLVIILWARLWGNPLENLKEAFAILSSFTWDGDMLFYGRLIKASRLPWEYIPGWILVTTPIYVIFFFVFGFVVVIAKCIKLQFNEVYFQIISLLIIIGTIAPIIALNSVIYDGWRHVYYIYPAMVLVSVYGFLCLRHACLRYPFQRLTVLIVYLYLCFSMIAVGTWMYRNHPYQNVYFNFLAGRDFSNNFDVDYWGLSNKQAIEYIAKSTGKPFIKIAPAPGKYAYISYLSLIYNLKFLPRSISDRFFPLEESDINDADYVVQSLRGGQYAAPDNSRFKLIHSIIVDGVSILNIYKSSEESINNSHPESAERGAFNYSFSGNGRNMLLGVGGAQLVGGGWSNPENWGVWSDGRFSKIMVPVPKKFSKLKVNLIPYLKNDEATKMVSVYLNDVFFKNLELSKGDNILTISQDDIAPREKFLIIKFIYPNGQKIANEPRDINMAITYSEFE